MSRFSSSGATGFGSATEAFRDWATLTWLDTRSLSEPPTRGPATTHAKTSSASSASTGGSTLLSRKIASTNPWPAAPSRRVSRRKLGSIGPLFRRGLWWRRRRRRGARRHPCRLKVDLCLYLHPQHLLYLRLGGRVLLE